MEGAECYSLKHNYHQNVSAYKEDAKTCICLLRTCVVVFYNKTHLAEHLCLVAIIKSQSSMCNATTEYFQSNIPN